MRTFSLVATLIVGFAVLISQTQASAKGPFKELQNLQSLGQESEQLQLPIMLMFGAEWCEYCELLNEYVFNPMVLGGLYDGKVVLMRHVGVDEDEPVPDWNGELIKKSKLAYKLDADLTPTVLFVDANGKEVAPRIVGIPEITLYTSVIHRNLNIAYTNMGLNKRIPVTPELLEQQVLENMKSDAKAMRP